MLPNAGAAYSNLNDGDEYYDSDSASAAGIDDMRSRLVSGEGQRTLSSNRPVTTILATDSVINGRSGDKGSTCCGVYVSGNSKVLLVSIFLFLSITGGQYFAAIIAHSISLKADCVSMLVDALSYMGNLAAECSRSRPRSKKRLELVVSLISFCLLFYFTSFFLLESVKNISHVRCLCQDDSEGNQACHLEGSDESCEPEEDVNPWIVFGFALGGLLFDAFSLVAYKVFSSKSEENDDDDEAAVEGGRNVNMLSALMHVLSDLLRSTTTLVESAVLFYYTSADSVRVDGWCALIVCSCIALGALWSIMVWLREVFVFCGWLDDREGKGDDVDGGGDGGEKATDRDQSYSPLIQNI